MLSEKLLLELQDYVEKHLHRVEFIANEPIIFEEEICKNTQHSALEDFINKKREPRFNQVLFNYIDKRAATSDSDIYKKAGIDRRHFSKIRSNPSYKPSKNTVIALALALELNKKEIDRLLSSAGYSLSDSDTFDLIIQFCIEKKIFNIHNVNQALDYFSLKPLGRVLE